MSEDTSFSPFLGRNTRHSALVASSEVDVDLTGANAIMISGESLTHATVFVRIGNGSQTATDADLPITASGKAQLVPLSPTDDTVAVLSSSGSLPINFAPGHVTVGR